jgi:hypothetical protein
MSGRVIQRDNDIGAVRRVCCGMVAPVCGLVCGVLCGVCCAVCAMRCVLCLARIVSMMGAVMR